MELKVTVARSPTTEEEPVASGVREPVATFVELDQTPKVENIEIEPRPSERSANATSDVTVVTKLADGELTTTAPSLFDNVIGLANPSILVVLCGTCFALSCILVINITSSVLCPRNNEKHQYI